MHEMFRCLCAHRAQIPSQTNCPHAQRFTVRPGARKPRNAASSAASALRRLAEGLCAREALGGREACVNLTRAWWNRLVCRWWWRRGSGAVGLAGEVFGLLAKVKGWIIAAGSWRRCSKSSVVAVSWMEDQEHFVFLKFLGAKPRQWFATAWLDCRPTSQYCKEVEFSQ